jgi:predicted enzyme related to lactoylglutathione lyase
MICLVTAGAVIYVTGLSQMRAFYQECFGLEITDSAGDYCVLRSGAWTLSLVATPAAAAVQISIPPARRDRTPVKLAFGVPDIEGLRPLIARLGGQLDPGHAWEFRHLLHCDCLDPEGNVVQLVQTVGPSA